MVCIAFLIRWYVLICFFHVFWSFLCNNSPCCIALFISIGREIILHVFSMISKFFVLCSLCGCMPVAIVLDLSGNPIGK